MSFKPCRRSSAACALALSAAWVGLSAAPALAQAQAGTSSTGQRDPAPGNDGEVIVVTAQTVSA